MLATHADLLLWRLFYNFDEGELGAAFRNKFVNQQEGTWVTPSAGLVAEEDGKPKVKVPKIGRQYLACTRSEMDPSVVEEAATWTIDDWKAHIEANPPNWRRFFEDYVRPLAMLARAMHATYTSRARDQLIEGAVNESAKRSRSALKRAFWLSKGLTHRTQHVTHQARGEPPSSP